jgi:hypothetical protein
MNSKGNREKALLILMYCPRVCPREREKLLIPAVTVGHLRAEIQKQNLKNKCFATIVADIKILILVTGIKQINTENCVCFLFVYGEIFTLMYRTNKCSLMQYVWSQTNCCVLLALLFDTLMMVAEVTGTCRWIVIYDEAHFIIVHLLACYISVNTESFNNTIKQSLRNLTFVTALWIIQINQPTRCNNLSILLLEVYLQLNMFWASSRPSSGAHQLQ